MNVFEPKQLTAEASRASMIGASMMIAGFEKYPLDDNIVKQGCREAIIVVSML